LSFGGPSRLILSGLGLRVAQRQRISFRSVNRPGTAGFDPGLQRHHLLPRQLLTSRAFTPMLEALGRSEVDFEDFRSNGLLLPANDSAVLKIGLPLHRGPHRDYNAMVIERVGQIEATWSASRLRAPECALEVAYERLELLQRALRRRLLDQQRRLRLNSKDPLGSGYDFSELDKMAALLWPATQPPEND
jgi:A nuclease family of the HNH/ENDO VII superfamily with conserved AHH